MSKQRSPSAKGRDSNHQPSQPDNLQDSALLQQDNGVPLHQIRE